MKLRLTVLAAAVAGAVLCLVPACNKGSTDGDGFSIDPDSVTLYPSDTTAAFTVQGGHEPFSWAVSDKTLGTISGGGITVTYTRVASKEGVNDITVTDGLGWSATASVIQTSKSNAVASVEISPTDATLDNDGDKEVFTASGGDGNYSWDVGVGARGSVVKSGGKQAVYTRLATGDNTVIVTDGDGRVAIADITQPAASPLSISPSSASVSSNGATQVFTASGGAGSYTWAMVTAHGSLSPGPPFTGNSIVYTSTAGHDQSDVVQVTDGSSTVFVTVTKF